MSEQPPHSAKPLRYLDSREQPAEAMATILSEDHAWAGSTLRVRRMRLDVPGGSREVIQVLAAGDDRSAHDALDNEILAGLRLARLIGPGPYPRELSRLIGYDANRAEPFALFERLRGEPAGEQAGKLLNHERRAFQVSLLTGLRWLSAAGVAHRGIGPDSVRWNGTCAQITNFTTATVVGAPRAVVGALPWAAPEQRSGRASGDVSDRDDMWAAGRLIHYMLTGDELSDRDHLRQTPDIEELLDGVFDSPGNRPTSRELLVRRLREPDTVPLAPKADQIFEQGRAEFQAHRERKHPQTCPAPDEDPPGEPFEIEETSSNRMVGVLIGVIIALLLAGLVLRLSQASG